MASVSKIALLFSVCVWGSLLQLGTANNKPCLPRKYNHSSVVCVCNAEYCDEVAKVEKLSENEYIMFSSSMGGDRFLKTQGKFSVAKDFSEAQINLHIEKSKSYQKILGFGGSFTDAAGLNILSLSEKTQENLISSYFSENGLEYNMGRVPISGCDFSTHPYAYNMYPANDTKLTNYSLTMEDYVYKIPLIKRAQALATDEILLTSATWSPPLWMKTNDNWGGSSALLPEYYQTWADYHYKFLEEYDKEGVKIWAVSTGNEPSNGIIPVMAFNSLGWLPSTQAKWLVDHLGPTIRNSRFADVKILGLDDQSMFLPWWIEDLEKHNPDALKYIDGIAMHWYWNDLTGTSALEKTHNRFPNKFLIATEACVGDKPWQFEKVELGSWERGEMYIKDIIDDLNHWFTGWIDWNLALDVKGGPNWFDNHVDSPIIVLPESDEFLKQPLFYAMGHFSKFIPRDSIRVKVNSLEGKIDNVAFLRPDGGTAVVLFNPDDNDVTLAIREGDKGEIELKIQARSVNTIIYW